ncbi:MAG: cytochrome C oxidase subunit IV family protein [Desulfobacterales bacterium]|nr:cytochrome C oxidase subunit IV family protein [Desulfobacterales bacterium]
MTAHTHTAPSDNGIMQAAAHLVSPRVYVTIFLALMVLTAVTVGVAYVDLGPFNTLVALLIAFTKMMLVVLYFMHVRYSSRLTWAVVGAGFFWLALLLLLTLSDYVTRGQGWLTYG